MSKIDQLVKTIVKAIDEKDRKKTSALDTVATVSRIDGDTAWVTFAGSDSETPVKQTIAVKKGDKVQVRASKGSAWITGNITSPPTDNTLAEEAVKKSDTATKRAKRAEDMSIVADVMYYLASDQDEGVTTEDEGWTQEPQEATVALPYLWCYHEYTRGNGTKFNSDPVIISRYTEGGAGVQSITTYYALGTSTSTAPTSGWATSFTYLSGYYIWRKELISLTDGTTTWSAPVYDGGLTETCSLSYDSAQYFWTKSTGGTTTVPTGSYVTQVTRSSYESGPTGSSLLLNSDGIKLRSGINTVASFLSAGVSLYNLAGTKLAEFLSDGLTFYNGAGRALTTFSNDDAIIYGDQNYNIRLKINGLQLRYGTTQRAYINWDYSSSDQHLGFTVFNTSKDGSFDINANRFWVNVPINVIGGITASGKLTAGAINSDLFAYTTVTKTISSVGANASGEDTSDPSTKTGWYPLAITNVKVTTGVASLRRFYFSMQQSGACTVTFGVQNDGSSAKDISCSADVLWVKTTA